jgi:hypothetical protein
MNCGFWNDERFAGSISSRKKLKEKARPKKETHV